MRTDWGGRGNHHRRQVACLLQELQPLGSTSSTQPMEFGVEMVLEVLVVFSYRSVLQECVLAIDAVTQTNIFHGL